MMLTLLIAPSGASALEPTDAFTRLKALVGKWDAKTQRGALIHVDYRVLANDSVLVQTFRTPSGAETLTVFHPDRARLLATHYCAQGNQPRLTLDPSSTPERLIFRFLDATNLQAPSASHLVRLELVLDGPDRYTEIETYEDNGTPEVTKLGFHRATR